MDWQHEHERLLAETLAFLRHVTGESLAFAVKAKVPLAPEIKTAARQLRRCHDRPAPTRLPDLRQEVGALFEALDNMQRVLHRQPDIARPAALTGADWRLAMTRRAA